MVICCCKNCHALLMGRVGLLVVPICMVKPLQMVQNAVPHLAFNKRRQAYIIPLSIELHWLPVAAHINFKAVCAGTAVQTFFIACYPMVPQMLLEQGQPCLPLASSRKANLRAPALNNQTAVTFFLSLFAPPLSILYPSSLPFHTSAMQI